MKKTAQQNEEQIKADAEINAIYSITDDANTPKDVKKFLLDYLFEKTGISIEFSEVETKPDNRTETIEFINSSILEWYQLFIEDYPKNRQEIFDILGEGSARSPNERVKSFWEKLKNGFLEVEKKLSKQ